MLKFKFIPIVQCLYVLTVFSLLSERCFAQSAVSNIDVWNFWRAYDLLSQTKDSIERANIINNQYLSKASKPLQAMLKMDSMTASTYLQRIKKNPARYNRVRMKTLDLAQDNPEISRLFVKYKRIYPNFHQPAVTFVIGTFNRGGTTTREYILIGAEVMALDTATTAGALKRSMVYTITHELTHVQQNCINGINNEEEYKNMDLLGWAMMEGSCDFIAEILLGQLPPIAYIDYGRKNEKLLWSNFTKEMYGYNTDNWLYNGGSVTKQPADLGYYLGYAICKQYYDHAIDKQKALEEIITLNYSKNEHHAFFKKANYQP